MAPARLAVTRLEERHAPAVFTVTSTADGGAGSLRAAMDGANAFAGADEIRFNFPSGTPSTITLLSALPALAEPVTIDGYTQPGSSVNTAAAGSNARILVEINGNGAAVGFRAAGVSTADGSIIRGLALGGFGTAISFADSFRTTVSGNFIGLRADGVTRFPNGAGLAYAGGYTHVVGGPTLADRNVISANSGAAITANAPGVTVQGNLIGTNAAGTAAAGNGGAGVVFPGAVAENAAVVSNVISGNGGDAISGQNLTNFVVRSNLIGTNASGTAALGNAGVGIRVGDTGTVNGAPIVVGGDDVSQRNVVSGNGGAGIEVFVAGRLATISGNLVGTDAAGAVALPNGGFGITAGGSVLVGGFGAAGANLVSGNAGGGLRLAGAANALNNVVGINAAGTAALPNTGDGVRIAANSPVTFGAEGAGNLVAFNTGVGISVESPAGAYRLTSNRVYGNSGGGILAPNGSGTLTLGGVSLQNGSLKITGTLAAPPGDYRVEFYGNAAGGAQGETYLGAAVVTVPAAGTVDFTAFTGAPAGDRTSITATATGANGRTTAFAAPATLPFVPAPDGGTSPPTTSPPTTSPPTSPPLPVPTGPRVVPVPDVTIRPGQPVPPIPITVVNPGGSPGNVTVTPSTSNPAVVAPGGITVTGSGPVRTLIITPTGTPGTTTITLVATSDAGETNTTTFVVTTLPTGAPLALGTRASFTVGAGAGGGDVVNLYNQDASVRFTGSPFPGFGGGVRTATADVTGDGAPDVIVGAGPGGPPRVVVLNGATGAVVADFLAFEESFRGGVFVAAGDLDLDGRADVVVTPDEGGGPRVQVRRGVDFTVLTDFFGIDDPSFRGGARAAVGDVNGDGRPDLIVAAGFGGGPRVAVYDGARLSINPAKLVKDFYAFEAGLRNGAYPAAGDVTGDGKADLIFGAGPGGAPRVRVADGAKLLEAGSFTNLDDVPATQFATFFAGDTSARGGVRVAAKDLDGDLRADVVTGAGDGGGSRVAGYFSQALATSARPGPAFEFDAVPGFNGGVFVG